MHKTVFVLIGGVFLGVGALLPVVPLPQKEAAPMVTGIRHGSMGQCNRH